MKSTCSYFMILIYHCVLHLSPIFGRKWNGKVFDLRLFRIQPHAPPPAGGFSKFIFVADFLNFKEVIVEEKYPLWLYLSAFPSIYLLTMETKTRRFRTLLYSATLSTSCQRFWKIHFCCRESPALLAFKPLILTPPAKIINNCLSLVFHGQFLYRIHSWYHWQSEKQNISTRNKILIKFYIWKWTVDNAKTNTMVTACQKTCSVFLYSLDINIKSVPGAAQYCRLCVDDLRYTKFPPKCSFIISYHGLLWLQLYFYVCYSIGEMMQQLEGSKYATTFDLNM